MKFLLQWHLNTLYVYCVAVYCDVVERPRTSYMVCLRCDVFALFRSPALLANAVLPFVKVTTLSNLLYYGVFSGWILSQGVLALADIYKNARKFTFYAMRAHLYTNTKLFATILSRRRLYSNTPILYCKILSTYIYNNGIKW